MTAFLAALTAFLLLHLIPPAPSVRRRLVALLGLRAYLTAYSLISVGVLSWLIASAVRAPLIPVWPVATWQSYIPLVVMPVALWFAVAGVAERNMVSISILPARRGDPVAPMARVTRHPLLWAFLLWATAHIPPNGDVVSLIMFGGLAALAAAGFPLLDGRARRRLGPVMWAAAAAETSIIPFRAILAGAGGRPHWVPLALYAVVALVIYALFLMGGHALLIGSDPLSWLQW
jgi:uncharacterized membrane protein